MQSSLIINYNNDWVQSRFTDVYFPHKRYISQSNVVDLIEVMNISSKVKENWYKDISYILEHPQSYSKRSAWFILIWKSVTFQEI